MNNVMLDLETLGTTADAVILSIGAVRFDLDSDRIEENAAFYASVSIDSNLLAGRAIHEDTLIWWMDQTPQARVVFTEPKITLLAALQSFSEWFQADDKIWSNGANFDIPMLEHAFKQAGMETPWRFWNARCVRTYTRELPGAEKVAKPKNGHHALLDAINQAGYVQAVRQRVFGVNLSEIRS